MNDSSTTGRRPHPRELPRPSRNLQRRIRCRQAVTGEPYMTVAATVQAEWERGQRYLSDPSVPADLAAPSAAFAPSAPPTVPSTTKPATRPMNTRSG